MNGMDWLRRQADAEPVEWPLVFHDRARDFLDTYGIDDAMIEGVVRHPRQIADDPHGVEVGYPVKRFRRGDIEVVVGYQDPRAPAVLFVHLHLPMDGSSGAYGGGNGPQAARTAPKTVQELHQRVEAAGYTLARAARHTRVLRPNGSLLMMVSTTPGSVRTLSKTWAQFLRLHAHDSLDAGDGS